jgi:quinol monooxygenase YgiN
MLIVQVLVHVHPEAVASFVSATLENARQSVAEPGVIRFDLLEQVDDPTRFQLIEIYRDEAAPAAHKATAHYAHWRETVEPMMAEPRRSSRWHAHFPAPAQWEMPT